MLIALMVTALAGCGRSHTADWRGVRASGTHIFKYNRIGASYNRVIWRRQADGIMRGSSAPADWNLGNAPGFSVRLPDGRVLKPNQLTVGTLRSLGGTEGLGKDHPVPGAGGPGARVLYFRYPKGMFRAWFDPETNQLKFVEIARRRTSRRDSLHVAIGNVQIAIGNRNGTKVVELPATRDELVELFGEPTSERSYKHFLEQ
jgi:hypothetical protein